MHHCLNTILKMYITERIEKNYKVTIEEISQVKKDICLRRSIIKKRSYSRRFTALCSGKFELLKIIVYIKFRSLYRDAYCYVIE